MTDMEIEKEIADKEEAERVQKLPEINKAERYIDEVMKVAFPQLQNGEIAEVLADFKNKIKLASDVAPFLEEKLVNIPLSAIFGESENQKTYVWVAKDNKVSKREVTVYSPTGEANALISAGIQPGETIVIAGVHQLVDGQTVKVIN